MVEKRPRGDAIHVYDYRYAKSWREENHLVSRRTLALGLSHLAGARCFGC